MLEIKKICKTYGNVRGIENISFNVRENEIVGFIGPNGAGKSTTMNIITGCLSACSGSIEADGINLNDNPVQYKKLIGYLPEQAPLYNELTVDEFLQAVLKFKKSDKNTEHINSLIEDFGLSNVRSRVIANLSKGYKQRVGLAQAFVGSPQYVVLDEPTVGLDPIQKKQTLELIKTMSKKCGIILSSHILSEISYVCDRVIIINEGKIVKEIDNVIEKKDIYFYHISGNSKTIIENFLSVEGVIKAEQKDGGYLVETSQNSLEEIFYRMAEKRCPIIGLELYHTDVEKEFTQATNKSERRKSS